MFDYYIFGTTVLSGWQILGKAIATGLLWVATIVVAALVYEGIDKLSNKMQAKKKHTGSANVEAKNAEN